MSEITFALIKPDAVAAGNAGRILTLMERDFYVADVICGRWSRGLVEAFYEEHEGKSFFDDLVTFMASGRMYAVTLVGPDAINRWRAMMGATDSRKAEPHTIRGMFGAKTEIIMHNAVHGSASRKDVAREMDLVRFAYVRRRGDAGRLSVFGDEAVREDRKSEGPPNHLDDEERDQIEDGEDESQDSTPIPEENYGVHAAHCCQVHGCKYESIEPARCPVETGKIEREHNRGWCQEPGLVEDPEKCRREGERMPGPDYHAG